MTFLIAWFLGFAILWVLCGLAAYRFDATYFLTEFADLTFTIPTRGFAYKPETVATIKHNSKMRSFIGIGALIGIGITGTAKHGWRIPGEVRLRELARAHWTEFDLAARRN